MGHEAKLQQQARERARARRVELDAERAAKDERIERQTAAVYIALGQRDEALTAVGRAEDSVADGLRGLLKEGVPVARAAALCELTVSEVRRLTRGNVGSSDEAQREPAAG